MVARCSEYERFEGAAAKLLDAASNVDGHVTEEEEAANDQDDVDGEGVPQVHHVQDAAPPPAEGGDGGIYGADCDAGCSVSEAVEKAVGKHHINDVGNGCLQLAQYELHSPVEVLDESIDIRDQGAFKSFCRAIGPTSVS